MEISVEAIATMASGLFTYIGLRQAIRNLGNRVVKLEETDVKHEKRITVLEAA